MQRAADEPFKFVQDSSFWYLTGIEAAELVLVLTTTEEFLIAPLLSTEREVFDGAHDLPAFVTRSGVTTIVGEREGWKRLALLVAKQPAIASLGAAKAYEPRYRMHTLPYRRRLLARLKRLHKNVEVLDIRQELAELRSVKQPAELQALQAAITITCQTLQEITQPATLAAAKHEYQLEAALSYGFRSRGADGHAFEPIVGAGSHSTTLHHVDNDGEIQPSDVIVLDVGAGVEQYAADITRTVSQAPLNPRQSKVFGAVERVQDYALGLLKPGVLLRDYENQVATFMGKELMQLGLITEPTPQNIRLYFPHATSHFLGLDTHDSGNYQQPLAENMVLTCEPGIYIPAENIGVRLEDDIVITKEGNRVLSAACPRRLGQLH